MTVWNWNLSLRQRQIDQPEELRCASRAGDCPWNNNGFSFYSSSLVSFSPGSPSHNTGKKSNHSFPKNRFPNCGMWVREDRLSSFCEVPCCTTCVNSWAINLLPPLVPGAYC